MPLKYVKKKSSEGSKQKKIGHYVLGKAAIDTVIKIDKDILSMSWWREQYPL